MFLHFLDYAAESEEASYEQTGLSVSPLIVVEFVILVNKGKCTSQMHFTNAF
jgi:hypothetical protein